MKIRMFTGGMAQTNGYLVETEVGNVLVDAPEGVSDWLDELGVEVRDVILTHQHYDHVQGVAELQKRGAKVRAFAPYSPELTLEAPARAWGMPLVVPGYRVDELFEMEKPLEIAGLSFQLHHVPGHSQDSVALHEAGNEVVFSGDALFSGSIGRTDLPGGSMETLVRGVREKLLTLPGKTVVYPGHGPDTSIEREARSNPFL